MLSSDILGKINFHEGEIRWLKSLLNDVLQREFITKVMEAGPDQIWRITRSMSDDLKSILPSGVVIDDTICVENWECSASSYDPKFKDAKWSKTLFDTEYVKPYGEWNCNRIHYAVDYREVNFSTYETVAGVATKIDFDESDLQSSGSGEPYRVSDIVDVPGLVLMHTI